MTTLTINQELNGIEIRFDSKPVADVLNTLKSNGFRWHRQKKVWYAKNTPERLKTAEEVADGKEVKITSKNNGENDRQKELKEKYMNIICAEVWSDKSMQDYAKKECDYIVELSDGNIISLDKPRLHKDFCFGMGMYGTYTDEDFQQAEYCAENARTNADYFITENMKQVTEKINNLSECLSGKCECYTYTQYTGQPEKSKLKTYSVVRIARNPEYEPGLWTNAKDLKKIDSSDIQAIIDGLNIVKERFEKRLKTYLKRYGLSKLNVWTYCRD